MRKLSLLVLVFFSSTLICEDRNLESRLKDLIKLKDAAYRSEREKLLNESKDADAFSTLGRSSTDWKVRIVANSISSEITNRDLWRSFYACMTAVEFGNIKSNTQNSIGSNGQFVYITMRCFGPDCFYSLGEILLSGNSHTRYLDVLVATRNDLSVELLQSWLEVAAANGALRANILYRLGNCVAGVDQMDCDPAEDEIFPGTSIIPDELTEIAAAAPPRILPAWKLSGDAREKALKIVATLLKSDTDEQVRAIAAQTLRHGNESTAAQLIQSLNVDASQWVRAMCAESLGVINSESAKKAIEAARSTEKSEEVLLVLEGKAKVWPSQFGYPKQSILDRRNEPK